MLQGAGAPRAQMPPAGPGRLYRVQANVLIVPGSPALVAELGVGDEASRRLSAAAREAGVRACGGVRASDAGGANPGGGRPVDIVCSLDERWRTEHTGSFRAWGAPQVTLRGGHYLGELVARYVLGDPQVREVRGHIGAPDPQALTVIVLDGPAGLTDRAPLSLRQGDREAHERIIRWLGGGEKAGVAKHVLEPALWEELARLNPKEAALIDADDTLGVGRYVAEWRV